MTVVPRYRLTTYGRRAFPVAGPTAWNSLRRFCFTCLTSVIRGPSNSRHTRDQRSLTRSIARTLVRHSKGQWWFHRWGRGGTYRSPKSWIGPKMWPYARHCMVNWCSEKLRSKLDTTRCQILRLKCTKFNFRCGCAPDPAGGAYSTSWDWRPLTVFSGPTSKGRAGEGWPPPLIFWPRTTKLRYFCYGYGRLMTVALL